LLNLIEEKKGRGQEFFYSLFKVGLGFEGVDSPLLFERGGGGGLGFIYSFFIIFVLCNYYFVIFSNF
jgi:hypothetical protein